MEINQSGPVSPRNKTQSKKIRPCLNCRQRHLKCNYDTEICRRCQKDDLTCLRTQSKPRFRRFAVDDQTAFSKDQTWISTAKKLKYVDETDATTSTNRHMDGGLNETVEPTVDESPLIGHDFPGTNDTMQVSDPSDNSQCRHNAHPLSDHTSESNLYSMDHTSTPDIPLRIDNQGVLPQSHKTSNAVHLHGQISGIGQSATCTIMPENETEDYKAALDRAILLRYFIQELAPWFDICDPEKHFGQSVPQRARSSPILLNAICTASARHLVRLPRYRNADGIVEWNGLLLPHINQDTALKYHNECIRDLLRFSVDHDQVRNVNLLAASIILRSDEETYVSLLDGKINRDVFLQVTGVFIDAQTPSIAAVPHTLPSAHRAPALTDTDALAISSDFSPASHVELYAEAQSINSTNGQSIVSALSPSSDLLSEGLRQACFWIALRQELYASFMAQRPFNFQLSKFDSFRTHSRATDAVWADRIVVFHAAVLEYCYSHSPQSGDIRARWTELRQESDRLEVLLPCSFQPIFHHDHASHPSHDFPEIWYLENWHAVAAAYFELTRLLLVSFDPRRPRFGNGYRASQREVTTVSKTTCWRLCGMALSNRQAPPIHLIACAAVALCGDYFDREDQRRALLWFLDNTEREIGFPTADLSTKLTEAWTADT